MADLEDARGALEAQLTAAAGCNIPATSIAWKGRGDPASKKAGSRWYRPTFMPGQPRPAGIFDAAPNRVVCVFQIDVFDPPNKGENLTATEAERILPFYKRGTALTRDGLTVTCVKAYRGPADDSDPAWFKVPVVVEVYADIAN